MAKAFTYVGLIFVGLALAVIPAGSRGANLGPAFSAIAVAAFVVAAIAYALDRWQLTPRAASNLPARLRTRR